ncbi:MAG: ThuA domain-containing protein, partial [Huintestinicola sp.]
GMGFIPLHSAHHSRIFKALCGTSCNLKWRHGDRERIWCVSPSHPIAEGIPEHFELPREEMYGEPFDIPTPDETVFMGWFAGGEVFRSGVTFRRGTGRIFYFQPGHEEYPVYHDENVLRIIKNAVKWAAPLHRASSNIPCTNPEPLEKGT